MGFWGFFFKKPLKINDDFFGEMVFNEWPKKPEYNYFECGRHFQPANDIVGIGIKADAIGPTQKQKDFFLQIETNYDRIISSIAPMIEDEFRNWKEDFEIQRFREEFTPIYLQIPRCDKEKIEWEISFSSIHDLNHDFALTMSNWKAVSLLIDG